MIKNCKVCDKEFRTYPSKIKIGRGKYCSKEYCLSVTNKILEENGKDSRFKEGQEAWNKKGFCFTKGSKNGNVYKQIHSPEHPFSNNKGYVREHRLVMEKHIGRYLKEEEVVHHKDGKTLNNSINNLEILTAKEHRILHLKDNVHKRWVKYPLSDNGNNNRTIFKTA